MFKAARWSSEAAHHCLHLCISASLLALLFAGSMAWGDQSMCDVYLGGTAAAQSRHAQAATAAAIVRQLQHRPLPCGCSQLPDRLLCSRQLARRSHLPHFGCMPQLLDCLQKGLRWLRLVRFLALQQLVQLPLP